MNPILKQTVSKQADEKAEISKKIELDKEKKKLTKGMPKRIGLFPDKPLYISFLHEYNYGLELLVHDIWEWNDAFQKNTKKGVLCQKNYKEIDPIYNQCDLCESFSDRGIRNKSYPVRAFIGFVHTLDGETFKPEGSDKIYELDPVRIIEVRFGKNKAIIQQLEKDNTRGKFQKCIFEQVKVGTGKDTTYMPLSAYDRTEDWLGEQFDTTLSKEIVARFNFKKSEAEDEIAKLILQAYENVKWDLYGLEAPVFSEEEVVPSKEKAADLLS